MKEKPLGKKSFDSKCYNLNVYEQTQRICGSKTNLECVAVLFMNVLSSKSSLPLHISIIDNQCLLSTRDRFS